MCCAVPRRKLLCRFSSSDTLPLARGSWAPPTIQLVEGCFSPDGTSFVVADVAGQFSLYGLGPPAPVLLAAPYDQFFQRDYDRIVQDAAGFAAYADPDTVSSACAVRLGVRVLAGAGLS